MIPERSPASWAATHVAFDTPTAERLTALGLPNVVRASDNLLLGPSRRDAAAHAWQRAAWWATTEELDRLHALDVRWQPPVAVWVSPRPQEQVNLWRACSRLADLGLSHREVLVIELPRAPRGNPDYDPHHCTDRVADHANEVLLARLAEARPWPRARYRRAMDLWLRYVDPDLSRLSGSKARDFKEFPQLSTVWLLLSSFLPRRSPSGTLCPSRFDEMLLHRLSDEWMTPVTVFARGPEAWEQLICCTGDLFIPKRLDQWATHSPTPAVERAPGPKPETAMLAHVYRITEHGQRLRDRGLAQLADAPPLPMAGTVAYASPWVLRPDGTLG